MLTKTNPERSTRCRAYSLRATIAPGSWQSESVGCLSMYKQREHGHWMGCVNLRLRGWVAWCPKLMLRTTWIGSSCGVSDSSFCWTHHPRCESKKNWKSWIWILLFGDFAASSVVMNEPSIGSTMSIERLPAKVQTCAGLVLSSPGAFGSQPPSRSNPVKNARLLQGENSCSGKV